ncbi:hypothetical protein H5392_01520 [Tessaracoccus sp. MC1865]|uniref:hypothetical protein n=1 Tax=Tessaracoccus sp. MC1865 TaxID=2760310 RepID=UPI001600D908|nr:hypothetical protein [Tessaracoccus sp. MC1865]MBB1482536.1 hypothetical protein [Tessaracoccus sp. MC1865]QTO38010.1 hypothetical protein J7D54_02570 [Tessaracoccus sp. MC1865]
MDTPRTLRNVANALNLSTPLGLVLGLAGRGRPRRQGHLIVFEQVKLPLVNASAMTVGDVVLVPGRTVGEVEGRIPDLLAHEEAHAWQYAYCLGLPFIPLYVIAVAWSMLRSGDRATANHFEVQADLLKGGYRVGTKRPLREGLAALRFRR